MGSTGATTAALAGRGNRFFAASDEEYQVILPSLPTGRIVLNTIFMHADPTNRPYRVEDFRDTLVHLGMLPEVLALGPYQMNHVWAITMKSPDATKKLLAAQEVQVKNRRCVIIDPNNHDLRLKLHWLLYGVTDNDVQEALSPYGKVTNAAKERWRAPGVTDKGMTTRSVTLKLKAGVTMNDIPHQLKIAGELALIVVPGRAPLCLRCKSEGHIRRECQVPRCSLCGRYGHKEDRCVKTYASATGSARGGDISEHLMDEAEAEDATRPETSESNAGVEPVASLQPEDANATQEKTEQAPSAVEDVDASVPETWGDTPAAPSGSNDDGSLMEEGGDSGSTAATKRTRENDGSVADNDGTPENGEPPAKAVHTRRKSYKPKPNIPPDRRAAGKTNPS